MKKVIFVYLVLALLLSASYLFAESQKQFDFLIRAGERHNSVLIKYFKPALCFLGVAGFLISVFSMGIGVLQFNGKWPSGSPEDGIVKIKYGAILTVIIILAGIFFTIIF